MILQGLELHHFRNYTKHSFHFKKNTIIIGKNTIGKTNILEALYMLSHGRSFRAEADTDVIQLTSEFAKVKGTFFEDQEKTTVEFVITKTGNVSRKKFLVNNIPKRSLDATTLLPMILFTPEDIELITGSPAQRRNYIDSVLLQTHKEYRRALGIYEKALRSRNRLLRDVRDGKRMYKQAEFSYWNSILIENGGLITSYRTSYINSINTAAKTMYLFTLLHDSSTITAERLEKYQEAELATGNTLIGPQRDDFIIYYADTKRLAKEYCSRGEQRLIVLQMKYLEIEYTQQQTASTPLLLLDDIFSELDQTNIDKVLTLLPHHQTVITTTHKEFVIPSISSYHVIEL